MGGGPDVIVTVLIAVLLSGSVPLNELNFRPYIFVSV